MTEKKKLTKSDLFLGTKAQKEVFIEPLGGTVTIRPLTEGEWTESQRILLSSMKGAGQPPAGGKKAIKDAMELQFDVGAVAVADRLQKYYIVAKGLVMDEPVTENDVKKMLPSVVEALVKEITDFSNVTPADLDALKSFRNK